MIASIDETGDTSTRSSVSMKRGEINQVNPLILKILIQTSGKSEKQKEKLSY